jgi:hypothetical protein
VNAAKICHAAFVPMWLIKKAKRKKKTVRTLEIQPPSFPALILLSFHDFTKLLYASPGLVIINISCTPLSSLNFTVITP